MSAFDDTNVKSAYADIPAGNLRTTEVLREGGWVKTRMMDLEVGDKFRLFEPDGTRVTDGEDAVWEVTEGPYMAKGEPPVPTVSADAVKV